MFEFVYLARPDSVIGGRLLYEARLAMGRQLAIEQPADADLVIPVPDSAIPAAIGYAEQSGLPFREGLIKNRYVGRTFIQPAQRSREEAVRLKFNPLPEVLAGKRVVVVDDSIVRGTTTGPIVAMLRRAGAREVHVRIHSPQMSYPCYMGVDTGRRVGADRRLQLARRDPAADRRRLARLPLHGGAAGRRRTRDRMASADTARPASTAATRSTCRWKSTSSCWSAGSRMGRSYREAGVDLEEARRAVELIGRAAASTATPAVLGGVGGFGSLFRLDPAPYPDPVLVASTDGVGTKLKVAIALGRHDTIGVDLVNHCINDIAVQGADPLFFLDYLATGAPARRGGRGDRDRHRQRLRRRRHRAGGRRDGRAAGPVPGRRLRPGRLHRRAWWRGVT